ncbi:MAG: LexA family transcriptional regulator [Clostridia bacterium]|nr:LexA family transcriptional regulator [Clostridia bacterium]
MDKATMIKELVSHYCNGNKAQFANMLGVKPQTINSWITRETFDAELIYANCAGISADWLLTGEGDMLNEPRSKPAVISAKTRQLATGSGMETMLEAFTETTKRTPGAIPLVSERAIGGFANEHFSIKERDVLAYYVIPKFRYLGVDFMIEVFGDSMIPKFYPGDIIACSIINHSRYIEWNKCHLIATIDRGLIVKRLMPGSDEDCYKAISENKDYPPFDIPKDEITGMARIVGVIHLE